MRGSASETSRSKNSHMRSPRSVTLAPIGMPSRSLNPAIDLRALVTTGFCPVIVVRSSSAASSRRPSFTASPMPMFTTILSRRGTCITFASPSSCCSAGTSSSRKRCFILGV